MLTTKVWFGQKSSKESAAIIPEQRVPDEDIVHVKAYFDENVGIDNDELRSVSSITNSRVSTAPKRFVC